MATTGRATGFTLIELLVVLAIIVLLAAVLLPALGIVQGAALQMRCASNQRQIAIGLFAYADDNLGLLPGVAWPQPVADHYDLPGPPFPMPCPRSTYNAPARPWGTNYSINSWLDEDHTSANPDGTNAWIINMARFRHAVALILVYDAKLASEWNMATPTATWSSEYSAGSAYVSFRHRGAANLLCCDGHVEARRSGGILSTSWSP
jgi:prepilin-type N-terminal cleavage/methylation domain-containing protein/prepilin-type processing-associated H-X9-DG protein